MQNLTRASEELFRRGPDECFATFDALWQHCQEAKARSVERWHPPTELLVEPYAGQLRLLGGDGAGGRDAHPTQYRLNDWSFTQLCSLAGVSKDTVNRLTSATAHLDHRPPNPPAPGTRRQPPRSALPNAQPPRNHSLPAHRAPAPSAGPRRRSAATAPPPRPHAL